MRSDIAGTSDPVALVEPATDGFYWVRQRKTSPGYPPTVCALRDGEVWMFPGHEEIRLTWALFVSVWGIIAIEPVILASWEREELSR